MKRLFWTIVAWTATSCGAAELTAPENPLRNALEQSIATLDPQTPLALRYNPAACACPPTELRLGGQWLRAELVGDANVQTWLAGLARTSPDDLPVALQVQGRVDREVLRTAQGSYATHVEVSKILAPLPQPATRQTP